MISRWEWLTRTTHGRVVSIISLATLFAHMMVILVVWIFLDRGFPFFNLIFMGAYICALPFLLRMGYKRYISYIAKKMLVNPYLKADGKMDEERLNELRERIICQ